MVGAKARIERTPPTEAIRKAVRGEVASTTRPPMPIEMPRPSEVMLDIKP
jgi:hypothetical protein